MKIKVIKKDGSAQDFDQSKIARVTEAAGLSAKEAQSLATNVANWAKEWAKIKGESRVSSLEIRWKVIEELQDVNKNAANLYIWYKKTEK